MGGEVVLPGNAVKPPSATAGTSSTSTASSSSVTSSTKATDLNILRRSSTVCSSSTHAADPITLRLDADWSAHRRAQVSDRPHARKDLSLSDEQRRWGAKWSSVSVDSAGSAWSMRGLGEAIDGSPEASSSNDAQPASIRVEQGIGANCSVVAGLEACIEHAQRFGSKVSVQCVLFLELVGRCSELTITCCLRPA